MMANRYSFLDRREQPSECALIYAMGWNYTKQSILKLTIRMFLGFISTEY